MKAVCGASGNIKAMIYVFMAFDNKQTTKIKQLFSLRDFFFVQCSVKGCQNKRRFIFVSIFWQYFTFNLKTKEQLWLTHPVIFENRECGPKKWGHVNGYENTLNSAMRIFWTKTKKNYLGCLLDFLFPYNWHHPVMSCQECVQLPAIVHKLDKSCSSLLAINSLCCQRLH